MNSTEKKRAEQFVTDWAETHPLILPPRPEPPVPEKWLKKAEEINKAALALEAEVKGSHFDFRRASYSRYGATEKTSTVVSFAGALDTHPAVAAHDTLVKQMQNERKDALQNLVRRIWNDEVTFQNVLDELEQLGKAQQLGKAGQQTKITGPETTGRGGAK